MIIRPLQKDDVKVGFSCGEPDLDTYFAKRAWPHLRDGIAAVFVLEDPATPGKIAGYYTLSAKSVGAGLLTAVLAKSLPTFPLPVTYIGCFAVAKEHQGLGYGVTLMGNALERCLVAAEQVGSVGVFLDSLNARSTTFYRKLGFTEIPPIVANHQQMFLPMATLRHA